MRLTDFDYELPEGLIAQEPLAERSASRLLWLHKDGGQVEHKSFSDLVDILAPGDLLVLNDTRVTARRLVGHRPSGARAEALVLRRTEAGHEALTRPAKKLRPGERIDFSDGLSATVVEDLGQGLKLLKFAGGAEADRILAGTGSVPLPPYVRRALSDESRYQTVYAAKAGSAAAPTAGLHFTPGLIEQMRGKGILTAFVTLDVGLDTFRPVTADDVGAHQIHGERCSVPAATAKAVAGCTGRVVAVGTTTVRTLETFATGRRRLATGERTSRLFVTPGFRFQIADGIVTNFHMPRTTMLLLVAAMAGHGPMMLAYKEAVEKCYRFLSFGDAMLVL